MVDEDWDEVKNSKLPPRAPLFSPKPIQMVIGLMLGVLSAVGYPGLILLLPVIWLIPAAISLALWMVKPARSLATGFAAASVAWLVFLLGFWLYAAFAQA